ncbi:hypothetical protein [Sphingobium aromaticiconvertens]|uniref:hypothetical protein n=1 Tax=Sphingobium aromaticiconvertens TaxID=365341 RepID=UPI00301B35D8
MLAMPARTARRTLQEETRVTLYYHQFNGVAPGLMVPGLVHCDPNQASLQVSKTNKMELAELSKWHDRHMPIEGYRELEREELLGMLKSMFVPLPDADWQEGENYTREQDHKREIAGKFAVQHNQAAFRTGKARILRLCPDARLTDR